MPTGAQDRDETELFAGEQREGPAPQRRFDLGRLEGQFARGLIGQQQTDLTQQPAKLRGRGVSIAHQSQVVLNERMGDDGQRRL
jgi:hypothetical protein